MFHKRDWLIFAAIVAVTLSLMGVAQLWKPTLVPTQAVNELEGVSMSAGDVLPEGHSLPAGLPSAGLYLVVSVAGQVFEPIPLTEETNITVAKKDTERENIIHVTKDSIQMASANCENQDCVEQGIVTAENRGQRLLGNMIICLPNEVMLELYSSDELKEVLHEEQ